MSAQSDGALGRLPIIPGSKELLPREMHHGNWLYRKEEINSA